MSTSGKNNYLMTKAIIRRALVLLVVALISSVPLVVGFVAGVLYAVGVIVWHALRLGFECGLALLREDHHARN